MRRILGYTRTLDGCDRRVRGEPVVTKRVRIESIDVVRGVIMILMALDHTRDFFGVPGVNPTDPATTTIPLFFTRWITHFCAPVFFLLTGTGAYLSLRKKSKSELSRFLFTRGLWLIFLEVVVVRCLGWQFNFDYHLTLLNVLWALGWAMITLSALVYLPASVVAAFGVVMIATHNLFDSVESANPIWTILHSAPGFLLNQPGRIIFVAYALIPWVGVTAAGYGLGQIYSWPPERRKAFLLPLSVGLTAAFFILRGINLYGDPLRWSTQRSAAFTVLSFLNTNEVSALAAISSDDARPGPAFLVGGRRQNASMAAARAHRRQSAHVLLSSAHSSDSHARRRGMLCALRAGALDVRIPDAEAVSHYPAAGMGILVADRLSVLGFGGAYALSALPLVCRFEAAPQRCLAELFLKRQTLSS